MANTSVLRLGGPTLALSVGLTAHAAAIVKGSYNDQMNYVSLLNTGTGNVAIRFSTLSTDVAVLPTDGTYGDFVLPAVMETPIVIACPPISNSFPVYVTAIGSTAANLVFIAPLVDQS
jgi:hypothetical protein